MCRREDGHIFCDRYGGRGHDERPRAFGNYAPTAGAGKVGIEDNRYLRDRQFAEVLVEPFQRIAGHRKIIGIAVKRNHIGFAGGRVRRAMPGIVDQYPAVGLCLVFQPDLQGLLVIRHCFFGEGV